MVMLFIRKLDSDWDAPKVSFDKALRKAPGP